MKAQDSIRRFVFGGSIVARFALAVLLTAACQSIGFGQVYSYTDASQSSSSVIGYGYVTGTYSSSTHIYSTNVGVYAPSGRNTLSSGSGTSATASLGFDNEHGNFNISTRHEGFCPYSSTYHTVGGSGGSTAVARRCSIGLPTFEGNVTPTDLKVNVICSSDVSGAGSTNVRVGARAIEPQGTFALATIADQTATISDGASREFSFRFERLNEPSPVCPCSVKGEAELEQADGATIAPPAVKVTTGSVAINP